MDVIALSLLVIIGAVALAGGVFVWQRRNPSLADEEGETAFWASAEQLWRLDVGNDRIVRLGIAGWTTEKGETTLGGFIDSVHRDDREVVCTALNRLIAGQDALAEATYRAGVTPLGSRWMHSRCRIAARDANGRVQRIEGITRDITALKIREERLRRALEGAGEELWEVDTVTHQVRRDNPFLELATQGINEDTPWARVALLIHPDDRNEVVRRFEQVLEGREAVFRAVYRVTGRDGQPLWLDSQGVGRDPDASGRPRRLIGTTRNVTDLKRGEERLRLALWGSRTELWDIDMTTGEISREGHLELIRLNPDRLFFSDLLDATHPEDADSLKRAMVRHAQGKTDSFQASFRLPDHRGHWRWLLARGQVYVRNAEGWSERLVGTLQDIADIRAVEDEIRELNEQLEARVAQRTAALSDANAQLERRNSELLEAQRQLVESEKMASLGGLVAGVAHEINTPMGIGVTAATHLLDVFDRWDRSTEKGLDDSIEKARRCIELIMSNLNKASELVRSFKQVAVDQTSEQRRTIGVANYVHEIFASLGPTLRRTAHRIEIDCDSGLKMHTYPGAWYQIIVNLVLNSLMHAFTEGTAGTISLTIRAIGPHVEWTYQDNGAGMSDDVRTRIFEPFFTTRRGSGGTGLGMHIVYNRITQQLKGSIRCKSEPGHGATFLMVVPA